MRSSPWTFASAARFLTVRAYVWVIVMPPCHATPLTRSLARSRQSFCLSVPLLDRYLLVHLVPRPLTLLTTRCRFLKQTTTTRSLHPLSLLLYGRLFLSNAGVSATSLLRQNVYRGASMPIVAVSSTLERAGARAAADAGADDDLFSSQIPKPLTKATAEDLVARFVLTQKHTPLEPTGSGGAGGGSGDANASSPGGRNSSSSSSSSGSSGGIVDVGPGVNGSHSCYSPSITDISGTLASSQIWQIASSQIWQIRIVKRGCEPWLSPGAARRSRVSSRRKRRERTSRRPATLPQGRSTQLEEEEDDYFLSSRSAAEV